VLGALAVVPIAIVSIYTVALSHANPSQTLAPGQSARADAEGARSADVPSTREDGADRADLENAFALANRNLVDTVKEYKDRLTAIETQKRALESQLEAAEEKLSASEHDGAARPPLEREFDLSDDDWKELAKQGTVRARLPCPRPDAWNYSPSSLQKVGLSPDDGAILRDALARSAKRTWGALRPLCVQALAGNGEMADKLGATICQALVFDIARDRNEDVDEAMRRVAEMRAGLRPKPAADSPASIEKMILAYSLETKALESDLAQNLGPEAAHRVVFTETGCWNNNGWGAGPRP
jgi:hypothetical protein